MPKAVSRAHDIVEDWLQSRQWRSRQKSLELASRASKTPGCWAVIAPHAAVRLVELFQRRYSFLIQYRACRLPQTLVRGELLICSRNRDCCGISCNKPL